MKATVYSKKGNKKKELVLNPEIYAARVNERLIELVRNGLRTNLRHGKANTKNRVEVRGGGKKPWRQKGTGRARHGSIRSPIWRGGGVVFGPRSREYYVNLPRTMKDNALISALSQKGSQKNVLVLEDATVETGKTKEWAAVVKALPLEGKRALCVVKAISENLKRASRNLASWVEIKQASDFNALHVLQREKVILAEDALAVIEQRLLKQPKAADEAGKVVVKPRRTRSLAVRKVKKSPAKAKEKKS